MGRVIVVVVWLVACHSKASEPQDASTDARRMDAGSCTSCDPATQYCLSGPGGSSCGSIPAACTAMPTCACIRMSTTVACGFEAVCATTPNGVIEVRCP